MFFGLRDQRGEVGETTEGAGVGSEKGEEVVGFLREAFGRVPELNFNTNSLGAGVDD